MLKVSKKHIFRKFFVVKRRLNHYILLDLELSIIYTMFNSKKQHDDFSEENFIYGHEKG